MTLVELIVTVAILGTIMSALAGAVITGLRTTFDTDTRVAHSVDRDLVAEYFVNDVASASTVSLTDVTCGGSVLGATPVVHLGWNDPVDLTTSVSMSASYIIESVGGDTRLVRRFCRDGALRETHVVASRLRSSSPAVVTCDASPCLLRPAYVQLDLVDSSGSPYTVKGQLRVATL